jgi:type VI protein secretion system component Hcp
MRPISQFAMHSILAAGLIAFAASSAAAAVDAYLKIGDIKGEVSGAKGDGTRDWIEVQSYWWGITHGAAAKNLNSSKSNREASAPSVSEIAVSDPGAGGRKDARLDASSPILAEKRQHSPVTFSKPLDRGSVSVNVAVPGCATGKHYDEATLLTLAYRYEFKDVLITSCAAAPSGGGGGMPTESISFNYGKIIMKAASEGDNAMWDLKKQKD